MGRRRKTITQALEKGPQNDLTCDFCDPLAPRTKLCPACEALQAYLKAHAQDIKNGENDFGELKLVYVKMVGDL